MHELREWLKTASVVGLSAALAVCAVKITRAVGAAAKELTVTEARLDDTLAAVNRPCTPGPCGTLAEINKSAVKLQDITVTLQRQVSQSAALVDAASESLRETSAGVNAELASLGRLTGNGAETAAQATEDLRTMNQTIAALQPVVAHADAAVEHLEALVADPANRQIAAHVEGMTASGDKMLADAQQKEHELLHPTKAKGFKAFLGGVVLWLHRLMPPIF